MILTDVLIGEIRMIAGLVIGFVVGGIVGVLFGRKNKAKVQKALDASDAALKFARDEAAKHAARVVALISGPPYVIPPK